MQIFHMSVYRSNGFVHLLIILYYLNAALLYSLHPFSCVASPVSVGSASTI